MGKQTVISGSYKIPLDAFQLAGFSWAIKESCSLALIEEDTVLKTAMEGKEQATWKY